MFPVGGFEVMVLGALVAAAVLGPVGWLLGRRLGVAGWAIAGLVWTLIVIGLVTLLPTSADPGFVMAEERLGYCSTDLGGPAPDGFWILSGGQRLLNTLMFVPPGALLVVAASRWRSAWGTVPLGLAALAAYSAGIEVTQLVLARLDRACDVTDLVDNVTGAVLGVGLGLVAAMILRPWRGRHRP